MNSALSFPHWGVAARIKPPLQATVETIGLYHPTRYTPSVSFADSSPRGGAEAASPLQRKAQAFSEPVLFCILFLFLPADNAIVGMGSKPINHHIEYAEYQKCADVGAYRQPLIGQAEHGQQLPYQGERKGQMDARH